MDEDGYVYIVDRIKDMIISGGENVYSVEVENCIALHPAVRQCAVIGIPNDKWGETVHAVVMCKPGLAITGDEFIAFWKERTLDTSGHAAFMCKTKCCRCREPARY